MLRISGGGIDTVLDTTAAVGFPSRCGSPAGFLFPHLRIQSREYSLPMDAGAAFLSIPIFTFEAMLLKDSLKPPQFCHKHAREGGGEKRLNGTDTSGGERHNHPRQT